MVEFACFAFGAPSVAVTAVHVLNAEIVEQFRSDLIDAISTVNVHFGFAGSDDSVFWELERIVDAFAAGLRNGGGQ